MMQFLRLCDSPHNPPAKSLPLTNSPCDYSSVGPRGQCHVHQSAECVLTVRMAQTLTASKNLPESLEYSF